MVATPWSPWGRLAAMSISRSAPYECHVPDGQICDVCGSIWARRDRPTDLKCPNGPVHQENRTVVRWVPRSMAPSSVATEASTMSPHCR